MTTRELREKFPAKLSAALWESPADFYVSFDEDNTAEYLTRLWEKLCAEHGVSLAEHAFFPEPECWLLEESEEGESAAYMLAAELPLLKEEPDTALLAIVFGTSMDPRVFAGTRLQGKIALQEWSAVNGVSRATDVGEPFADSRERRQNTAQQVYAVCDEYQE